MNKIIYYFIAKVEETLLNVSLPSLYRFIASSGEVMERKLERSGKNFIGFAIIEK